MKRQALSLLFAAVLFGGCTPPPLPAPTETIVSEPVVEKVLEAPEPRVRRPDIHVVTKGETLTAVALNYGLDYRELAFWNNLRNPDFIKPGQELRLSQPENQPNVGIVKKIAPTVVQPVEKAVKKTAEKAVTSDVKPVAKSSVKKTVVVGSTDNRVAENVAASVDAPFKTSPQAKKYIYSPKQLKKLRQLWNSSSTEKEAPKVAVATPADKPSASVAVNAPSAVRRRFDVDWSWPINRKVDEKFNEQRKGIDFFGKIGDPVYASAAGKVVYVGTGVKTYGRLVIIKHDNDYLTAYAHNSKVLVKEGDSVVRGGKIAEMGDSAASRPLLHFEVRKSGKPFDPLQVLPKAPR